MNWNASSSISGYLKSFFEVVLFDAAAAICQKNYAYGYITFEEVFTKIISGHSTSSNFPLILEGLTAK
jgi:hypothetical protein